MNLHIKSNLVRIPFHIILFIFILGGMLGAAKPAPVSAATECLTGAASEGNLNICVAESGQMNVQRHDGSSWVNQIFNGTSKGSKLYHNGTEVMLGYYDGTQATNIQNTKSGNTIDTRWTAGSLSIRQVVTYTSGNEYYRIDWYVTNNSGSTISDFRFFHGEDTYLAGGDTGAGFYDAGNKSVGVQKTVGGDLQRLILQAITTPYAYDSANYSTVASNAKNNALTNTLDTNESTDNGYAMEWRTSSLANGSTWTISAYEKFTAGAVGALEVYGPVSTSCDSGTTCTLNYSVSNPGADTTVTLGLSSTQPTWTSSITSPGASFSLTSGNSQAVSVDVTVPGGTADGTSGNFTLTASPTTGDSSSYTASVVANNPGAPPTSFSAANPPDSTYNSSGYSYSFIADGTPAPTYSLQSGTLPPGLSLGSNGVLSGTPTAAGTYSGIVVRATNAQGSLDTAPISITINKASTSTTITSDAPDPNVYGQTYPVSVSVTSSAGTPGGTVSIGDGTNTCNATLSGGTGSCSLAINDVGGYTLTASYGGSSNFATSSDTESHTTNKADTSTGLSSPYNPAPYGTPMQLTATVSADSPSTATPDGQVQFKLGGVNYGSPVSLSGGSALSPAVPIDLGTYAFTVDYLGSSNFNTSSSSQLDQVVEPAATTTSLVSDNNPSIYGEAVTYTATVSADAPSTATPVGSVQFVRNGVPIGAPVALDGSGQAQYTVPFTALWPETHTIVAEYSSSSANFVDSDSSPLSQVVNKADPVINFTPESSDVVSGETFGARVELVSSPNFIGPPMGTVSVLVDGAAFAGPLTLTKPYGEFLAYVDVSGFNFDTSSHTVTVNYSGDDYFLSDTDDFTDPLTVNPSDTSITIFTFDPSDAVTGQTVVISVSVEADAPGSGIPSGDVVISNGTDQCTATLDGSGNGTCNLVPTTAGQPDLTANYGGDANFNASSAGPIAGPNISKADTNITTFTFTPSDVVTGEDLTVNVSVESAAPGSGIPTGDVVISNGTDQCTASLDVNGDGSCTLVPSNIGQPDLTANYQGDANYNPSSAGPIAGPAVTKANTNISTFTFSPSDVVTGEDVTVNVSVESVAPGSGIPTGDVVISNGTDQCTASLDVNGDGSCTLIPTNIGSPNLTANYGGDANYNAASAGPIAGPNVTKADTSIITFEFNPAEAVTGETVLVNVSVAADAPGSGIPTGNVVISNGTDQCTAVLDGSGNGTCNLIPTAIGQPNLTVNYGGDANYNASSAGPIAGPNVTKADTSITTFEFSPAEVVTGEMVLVNVSVAADAPGSGIPTGDVVVSNGTDQCTATLDGSGNGSCNLVPTSIGQPDLTANYSGDANYNASSAGPISGPNVTKADTSITAFSFSPGTVVVGQPVTIDVSVESLAPGSGIPAGDVTISNGTDQCTATLDASGDGSCELVPTAPGQPDLNAAYAGDANYNESAAGPIAGPLVNKADTSTVTVSSHTPSVYGEVINFTASVSIDSPGSGAPTGTVQFFIDDTPFGDPVSLSSGTATSDDIASLIVGDHTVRAEYSGDSNFNSSVSANITQEVLIVGTSLILESDLNPAPYGESVTVTATVTADDPSIAIPDGFVQFYVNGVTYGSPVPMVNGQAEKVLPYTALWVGTHNITVVYLGNSNFETSNNLAEPLAQVIGKAEVDVSFEASAAPSVYGQPVSFTVTIVSHTGNITEPTGTINVFIDGVQLGGDLPIDGSQQATTPSIDSLAVGDHTITVHYSGDDQYLTYDDEVATADPFVYTDAHTVNKADSSINFDSISDMNLVVGEATTVTITVSAVAPGVGTPSGTVTVSNGTDSCEITLSAGSGNCDLVPTNIGSPDLTATYSGDSNFNGLVSAPETGPTVSQASTTTTITSYDTATLYVGEATTVGVTVAADAPGSGYPTGTVTVSNENGDECSITLASGTGSCDLVPTAPDADGMTLTAVYAGDTNYITSTSDAVTGSDVIKADTEILNLTFDPTDPVIGQTTTVSLTVGVVAPGSGVPTGTVSVGNGVESCEITLIDGAGSCTYQPTTVTSPGTETITLSYSGDDNFNAIAPYTVNGPVVAKADALVEITGFSPTTISLGESTNVTVRVSVPEPGSGVPTGTVSVTNGFDYCLAILDGAGEGDCDLTPTKSGQIDLQATYIGDARYNSATSGKITGPVVGVAPTTTTITDIDSMSIVIGEPVLVSVEVSSNVSADMAFDLGWLSDAKGDITFPPPTGNVIVSNGTDQCTAVLSDGTGACSLTPTALGSPDLTAAYQGDSNYDVSTSIATTGPTVNKADTEITALTFIPGSVVAGEPLTVTVQAIVSDPGTGYPSGNVTISNGVDFCTASLDASGEGSCQLTPSSSGQPDLTASYAGNASFNAAADYTVAGPVVSLAGSNVVISGSSSAVEGSSVQWTVTVTAVAPSEGTPTGNVQFYINGNAFGEAITLVNGSAVSDATSSLDIGEHEITVHYIGSVGYNAADSDIFDFSVKADSYNVYLPMLVR